MKVAPLASFGVFITMVHGLPECMTIDTFAFHYQDNKTKEMLVRGQCNPSKAPGAFYTAKPAPGANDTEWGCWNLDEPEDLRNDAEAKARGFEGACVFEDHTTTITPDEVETCDNFLDHNPVDCGRWPEMYWGACFTDVNEHWLCIDKSSDLYEGATKGDCKARAVRDDPGFHLYSGVCRFKEETPKPYKCDTVSTYGASDASTCGGDAATFDNACFSLDQGVVWQCFDKPEKEGAPCTWTRSAEGFYDGQCLFPSNPGYADAESNPMRATTTTTTTTTTSTTTTQTTTVIPDTGLGGGWVALLVILMVAAAGGGFFYWFRARGARPQPLMGGIR